MHGMSSSPSNEPYSTAVILDVAAILSSCNEDLSRYLKPRSQPANDVTTGESEEANQARPSTEREGSGQDNPWLQYQSASSEESLTDEDQNQTQILDQQILDQTSIGLNRSVSNQDLSSQAANGGHSFSETNLCALLSRPECSSGESNSSVNHLQTPLLEFGTLANSEGDKAERDDYSHRSLTVIPTGVSSSTPHNARRLSRSESNLHTMGICNLAGSNSPRLRNLFQLFRKNNSNKVERRSSERVSNYLDLSHRPPGGPECLPGCGYTGLPCYICSTKLAEANRVRDRSVWIVENGSTDNVSDQQTGHLPSHAAQINLFNLCTASYGSMSLLVIGTLIFAMFVFMFFNKHL